MKILKSDEFEDWLGSLVYRKARARILIRLDRVAAGNLGDVGTVGEGVSELRLDFGPGYRVYFVSRGSSVVLLCGGDKKSQDRDIRRAKKLAGSLALEDDLHSRKKE